MAAIGPPPSSGAAERIHDASEELRSDRHARHLAGAAHHAPGRHLGQCRRAARSRSSLGRDRPRDMRAAHRRPAARRAASRARPGQPWPRRRPLGRLGRAARVDGSSATESMRRRLWPSQVGRSSVSVGIDLRFRCAASRQARSARRSAGPHSGNAAPRRRRGAGSTCELIASWSIRGRPGGAHAKLSAVSARAATLSRPSAARHRQAAAASRRVLSAAARPGAARCCSSQASARSFIGISASSRPAISAPRSRAAARASAERLVAL